MRRVGRADIQWASACKGHPARAMAKAAQAQHELRGPHVRRQRLLGLPRKLQRTPQMVQPRPPLEPAWQPRACARPSQLQARLCQAGAVLHSTLKPEVTLEPEVLRPQALTWGWAMLCLCWAACSAEQMRGAAADPSGRQGRGHDDHRGDGATEPLCLCCSCMAAGEQLPARAAAGSSMVAARSPPSGAWHAGP